MTLIRKKSVLLAKIETTPGTAESLGNGDGVFHVYNVQPSLSFAEYAREGQRGATKLTSVIGQQSGSVSFMMNVCHTAEQPMGWSTFLPACGMVKGTGDRYDLKFEAPGNNVKTLTIGFYVDGISVVMKGCSGNLVLSARAGTPHEMQFTFTGVFHAVANAALPSPSYTAQASYEVVRFASGNAVIGATNTPVAGYTFDLGNGVQLIESDASVNGLSYAIIADRRPTLQIDPLSATNTSVSRNAQTLDYLTTAAITIHDFINIPAAQIVTHALGERSGLLTDNLTYLATGTPGANDEAYLTYATT